jgi:hypothetical protein
LLTGTQRKEFVSLDTNGILLLAGALKHRTPEEFDRATHNGTQPDRSR